MEIEKVLFFLSIIALDETEQSRRVFVCSKKSLRVGVGSWRR